MDNGNRSKRLLIIDDDQFILRSFVTILEREGYKVVGIDSGNRALELIKKERFHLILTDLMMDGVDGLGVLKEAKKLNPEVVVVIITGFDSMESALEAMRCGAYDYLIKPCAEIDLKMTVKRGLEKLRIEKKLLEIERLKAITETAIKTSREINTPLETIIQELDVLSNNGGQIDKKAKEEIKILSKEAKRIKDILEKMSSITEPVISEYLGDIKMVDIEKSLSKKPVKKPSLR
jgi:DNA-binding NtrC family response regulator